MSDNKKTPYVYDIQFMDVDPTRIATRLVEFDYFATLSISVGATKICLFFSNKAEAYEALNNLSVDKADIVDYVLPDNQLVTN